MKIDKNLVDLNFKKDELAGLEYLIENTSSLKNAVELQYLIDIYKFFGDVSFYRDKKQEVLKKMDLI